jgi:membrane protease YdiL (CAAX protease family)
MRMAPSRRIRRYLVTTFGITWSSWWTLAALGGLDEGPAPLLIVGGSGPLVAALAVRTRDERSALLQSSLRADRLGTGWWPVLAVGLGPALAASAAGAVTGHIDKPHLIAALGALGFALVAGIGEEPGWRGTLLGPWIEAHGPLSASMRVGVVWALWHLPLYFASGTYQADQGLVRFATSMVELPALSILLTWTFERGGWLVVAPLLAHALGNAAGEILPGHGTAAEAAQSISIVAAALVIGHRMRTRPSAEQRR